MGHRRTVEGQRPTRSPRNVLAVSYTHLDVYKRQGMDDAKNYKPLSRAATGGIGNSSQIPDWRYTPARSGIVDSPKPRPTISRPVGQLSASIAAVEVLDSVVTVSNLECDSVSWIRRGADSVIPFQRYSLFTLIRK